MEKEELQVLLKSLSISDKEKKPLSLEESDFVEGSDEGHRSILGKFITNRDIVIKDMKIAIQQAWDVNDMKVIRLKKNIYQFIFSTTTAPNRIISGGPWCFSNILLVTKPWEVRWEENQNLFDYCPFWMHISGLPRYLITERVGSKIAKEFGAKEFQIRETTYSSTKFVRLKADIDVNQPLRRLFAIKTQSNTEEMEVAAIQYERLPFFCFKCGRLSHTMKGCPLYTEEPTEDQMKNLPFKAWLKTSRNSVLLATHSVEVNSNYESPVHEEEIHRNGNNQALVLLECDMTEPVEEHGNYNVSMETEHSEAQLYDVRTTEAFTVMPELMQAMDRREMLGKSIITNSNPSNPRRGRPRKWNKLQIVASGVQPFQDITNIPREPAVKRKSSSSEKQNTRKQKIICVTASAVAARQPRQSQ